jgi:hypothetical protein
MRRRPRYVAGRQAPQDTRPSWPQTARGPRDEDGIAPKRWSSLALLSRIIALLTEDHGHRAAQSSDDEGDNSDKESRGLALAGLGLSLLGFGYSDVHVVNLSQPTACGKRLGQRRLLDLDLHGMGAALRLLLCVDVGDAWVVVVAPEEIRHAVDDVLERGSEVVVGVELAR